MWILLIPFIIIVLLVIKNKKNTKNTKNKKKHLIVSHCTEDLQWINDYIHTYDCIYIYTKCNKEIPKFTSNTKIRIKTLPNSGTEVQTYLYHIINNWGKLADYNVFVTGTIGVKRKDTWDKIHTSKNENIFNYSEGIDLNFSLDTYEHENNKVANSYVKSKYSNLQDFVLQVMGEDALNDYKKFNKNSYVGIMGIKKENIYKNDIELYKKLHNEVDIGPINEVGHFIERLWMFILY